MSLPHLTVAYITSRREPMISWFLDSLDRERKTNPIPIRLRVVIVDFLAGTLRGSVFVLGSGVLTPPKPTVWQGPHRLTLVDYFAAANARNTAICHAQDGWIAFVDDLSVLMPGWLSAIHRAMEKNYCVFGAYKKVKRLVVDNGKVVNYEETPGGVDTRWVFGSDNDAIPITSFGTYGCSMAMPVEALLKVNGFDERCDCLGLGSEDDMLGLMLKKQGCELRYDRRMLTFESEERHHWETPMKRVIETGGLTPDKDASWAILREVRDGPGRAPNEHFGPGGISALRQKVIAGEPFPPPTGPLKNWYSGKPTHEY